MQILKLNQIIEKHIKCFSCLVILARLHNKRVHPAIIRMPRSVPISMALAETPGAKCAAARRDGQSNLFDGRDAATTFAYISP